MIKRAKQMIGNIVAACLTLLIFSSWFVLPAETEASVSYLEGINEPSNGAGRVICAEIATEAVETSIDIPETETAEICDSEASEEVIETETEFVEDIYVPDYVEVIPEADPIIYTDIDALIVQVAGEFGLPWQLVRAVVWAESTFDPFAVSDHPDYGLMQVWEQIWIDYGYDPKDPIVYDPETNLRMGCQVLKQKIDAHDGDFANALTCYRFGDGGALEKWRQGEYSNWYNERVLGKYYEYLRGGK